MKTHPIAGLKAFTLIELMAVITIMVILAGLVAFGVGYALERQSGEKAKLQISQLSKAIEEYRQDMGSYPGSAENTPIAGNISRELYQALFKDGDDYANMVPPPANWTKAKKIYLPALDPRTSKQGWVITSPGANPPANLEITDPWGRPYLYRKGSNAQNPDFDLWSQGKDGVTDPSGNLKDDIRNNRSSGSSHRPLALIF